MEIKSVTTSPKKYESSLKPKELDVQNVTEVIQERLAEKQAKKEEDKKEVSKVDLEKSINSVNKFLEVNFTSLKFQVHEDLDRLFVEIVDRETKEVVREIPPKEFLDMISSMLEFVGILVDKKV